MDHDEHDSKLSPTVGTPLETWGADAEQPQVAVKVNGEVVGGASPSEPLGVVADRYASQFGLRAYSVLVDGCKATTGQRDRTLTGARTIELVAKDARGVVQTVERLRARTGAFPSATSAEVLNDRDSGQIQGIAEQQGPARKCQRTTRRIRGAGGS